jgi:hypothetical protein
LEKLEEETDEGSRFLVGVGTTEVGEFRCSVEESGGVETETKFFPVEGVEDSVSVGVSISTV